MDKVKLRRADIIYPELSYRIVGILFDVYNTIGAGYQEKHYQRAISEMFTKNKLMFKEQVRVPIEFKESIIGSYFFRFFS